MSINEMVLLGAAVVLGTLNVFLIRRLRDNNRELKRMEEDHRIMSRELLQARSQFAKEMAEAAEQHGKRVMALQGNVNDLAALVKERRS